MNRAQGSGICNTQSAEVMSMYVIFRTHRLELCNMQTVGIKSMLYSECMNQEYVTC